MPSLERGYDVGLLKPATNQTVFLKAGIHGFQGSGKTFTAKELAIGLSKTIGDKKPVAMLDTETGSDFLIKDFEKAGIPFMRHKSRAFVDLIEIMGEAERDCSVLIIDSITHVWQELMQAYKRRLNRQKGLLFQDWSAIKEEWQQFTTLYINSQLHIIMCGRAGYEYDMQEDESGKRELIKTGNKMKAETETGYEPNLGLFMERLKKSEITGNPNEGGIINRCHVEKDRSNRMNGKIIDKPKFKDFKPVIEFLNVGGVHVGIDDSRSSEDMFDDPARSAARYKQEIEATLDEIKTVFTKQGLDGSSREAKAQRVDVLEKIFGNGSWKRVEAMPLEHLHDGLTRLKLEYDKDGSFLAGDEEKKGDVAV